MTPDIRNESLIATTRRFTSEESRWIEWKASVNRGLESYLTEAYCRCGPRSELQLERIDCSLTRVMGQAVAIDQGLVWSWERTPTVPGVAFPADWDDTSKAVDAVHSAARVSADRFGRIREQVLPPGSWERRFLESIYESRELGVDIRVAAPSEPALSVFFGPGSEKLSKRDDPMVTVVAVRTTALYLSSVLSNLRGTLADLTLRPARVLRACLDGLGLFSAYSRYYYSLGHFAFRFQEMCEALGIMPWEVGVERRLFEARVEQASSRLARSLGTQEDGWWQIVGSRLGMCELMDHQLPAQLNDSEELSPRPSVEIVFRHRRLGHYYGTRSWSSRLLALERFRLAKEARETATAGAAAAC